MTAHDPLCAVSHTDGLPVERCWRCHLIAAGRRAGIEQALAVVDQGGRAAKQIRDLLAVTDG